MLKILLFISIFFLLLVSVSYGDTYYIDNTSVVTGDGTTTATAGANAAWDSYLRVTGIVAGDSILFKRGQVHRKAAYSTIDTADSSWNWSGAGTASNYITVGAYGTGTKPIISGARNPLVDGDKSWVASSQSNEYYLVVTAGSTSTLYNKPFRLFLNLGNGGRTELDSAAVGSLADGQFGWGDNGAEAGFNTIYLRDDSGTPTLNIEVPQYSGGVGIIDNDASQSYMVFQDLIVEMSNATAAGAKTTHGIRTQWGVISTVLRCEFRYLCGNGGKFGFNSNCTTPFRIEESEFYGNIGAGSNLSSGPASCGIIRKNRFYENTIDGFYHYNGGGDHWVIEENAFFDNTGRGLRLGNIDSTIVKNNVAYGNSISGMQFEGYGSGNRVTRNLSYNNTTSQFNYEVASSPKKNNVYSFNVARGGTRGFSVNWQGDSLEIINNTIDDCGSGIWMNGVSGAPGADNITIKNNIVSNSSTADMYLLNAGDELDTFTSDYNCFTGESGIFVRVINGRYSDGGAGADGDYTTIVSWTDSTGNDTNSISAAPGYVDSTNGDFRLASISSSAVDAGVNYSYWTSRGDSKLDMDQKLVFDPPDLGAYQYKGVSPLANSFFRLFSRDNTTSVEERLGE